MLNLDKKYSWLSKYYRASVISPIRCVKWRLSITEHIHFLLKYEGKLQQSTGILIFWRKEKRFSSTTLDGFGVHDRYTLNTLHMTYAVQATYAWHSFRQIPNKLQLSQSSYVGSELLVKPDKLAFSCLGMDWTQTFAPSLQCKQPNAWICMTTTILCDYKRYLIFYMELLLLLCIPRNVTTGIRRQQP